MNTLVSIAIRHLNENPSASLTEALNRAHMFWMARGRSLLTALQRVVPASEWGTTRGPDAIAALELADSWSLRIRTMYKPARPTPEPNPQNIPVRTELGREIRRAFIADAEPLSVGDLNETEQRVLAWVRSKQT